jgi:4-oxalomesaconate hydratase
MNQSRSLLVVGAHAADFVWRAAGIIAVVTKNGGRASVVALTYGERGESGELWKEPNQTVENVKRIRHKEATLAAEILGATFQCFDLGDYPLQIDTLVLVRLTMLIRELAPDVIITHTERDPFNPDHRAMAAQSYLHQYQTEIAKYRANHARRISGRTDIQYAEAFQRVTPQVVDTL